MRLVWLLLQKQSCHFLRSGVLPCTAVKRCCICILFVIKSYGKLNFQDKCLFSWCIDMLVHPLRWNSSISPGNPSHFFPFEWSLNRIKQQLHSCWVPFHLYPFICLSCVPCLLWQCFVNKFFILRFMCVHTWREICHRHVKNLPINFAFQKYSLPTVWHRFHWLSP